MAQKSRYFFEDIKEFDEKAVNKNLTPAIKNVLEAVLQRYHGLVDWQQEAVHQVIVDVAEQYDVKLGKLAQPVRVAVTGGSISPPLDVTLTLIGREHVLRRLQVAIDMIAD